MRERPELDADQGLLLCPDEVSAAVLLVAILSGLHAERLLFAETDGVDAIGGDAQGDEILLRGAGTTIAESKVVFGGAALVAVTFDGDALGRIAAEILGGLSEGGAGVGTNVGFVEVEIGVANFTREDFILRGLGRRSSSGCDGDARTRCCGAAWTTGSDGVGSRSGRRDGLLAFSGNSANVGSDGELRCVGGSPSQRRSVPLFDSCGARLQRHSGLSSSRRRRRARRSGNLLWLLVAAKRKNGSGGHCDQTSAIQ